MIYVCDWHTARAIDCYLLEEKQHNVAPEELTWRFDRFALHAGSAIDTAATTAANKIRFSKSSSTRVQSMRSKNSSFERHELTLNPAHI